MLFRTHLVFAILFILLTISFVDNRIWFIIFALVGFIVPDLDSRDSRFGRRLFFRPVQFFLKHRGFMHSLTFGFLVSLALSIIFPVMGVGFFVGFSSHIFSDSFTKEGIAPFWPYKKRSYSFIETGSYGEGIIFYSLVFIDTLIFVLLLFKSF
jgi:membrane-bound metal-dependent hydrolase YbcI (DUF457 family)